MLKSLCITMALAAFTLTLGCDADLEDRALDLEALADEDLDPEIRAHLVTELAATADGEELPPGVDKLTAASESPVGLCLLPPPYCPPPQEDDPNAAPVVINPYTQINAQGNVILFMSAAGSHIQPGATVKLLVPFTTQSFGPYSLSFDNSGTQLRSNVTSGFPAGTCRIVQVTNPDLQTSNQVSLCR